MPGLWFVGAPPQTTGGSVQGLTADGGLAVGATGNGAITPGFTWTASGGRYDFGFEPGMPAHSPATAVDSTGQTIVGWASLASAAPVHRAYRRVGSGPLQDLGILAGTNRSFARGVSGDGSVVTGYAEFYNDPPQFTYLGQAFRWEAATGMVGLGYLRPNGTYSRANGISRDGTTIVGYSVSNGPFGDQEAFKWTAGSGMEALPGLPGAPFQSAEARAVNADGAVIVGGAPAPDSRYHAVLWTASGIEDLGVLPGFLDSTAFAVDDAGTVVGGDLTNGSLAHAFVWTPATSMLLLSDYLAGFGVSVPADYRLEEVFAISGDGLTFAGVARHLPTNRSEGFVATIPAPASVLVLLAPWLGLLRRKR